MTAKKKKAKLPPGWVLIKQVKGKDGVLHLHRKVLFLKDMSGDYFRLNVHVHKRGGVLVGENSSVVLQNNMFLRMEVEQIGKLFYGDNWEIKV